MRKQELKIFANIKVRSLIGFKFAIGVVLLANSLPDSHFMIETIFSKLQSIAVLVDSTITLMDLSEE